MREISLLGVIPEWTSRRRSPDDRPGAKTLQKFWRFQPSKENLIDEIVDFAGSIEENSDF